MKKYLPLVIECILVPSFLLTGCKKEIQSPLSQPGQSQLSSTSTSACNPSAYATFRASTGEWNTIVQKWYAGDKIQHIKTHFTGGLAAALFHTEPILNIDWGAVSYEGNQVRVNDVGKNLLAFRATLDALGKPVASYLYNYTGASNENLFIDTSYYYYTGDRLTSIIQLFEYRLNNSPYASGWEQYTLTYNPSGTLAYYSAKNEETIGAFNYWSTSIPSYADYTLTTAFKMLEYLDLTKLVSNTCVSEFKLTRQHGHYLPFTYFDQSYYNFSESDGLLRYYLTPMGVGKQDYYIGWNCGATNAAQISSITSLNEFKKVYSSNK